MLSRSRTMATRMIGDFDERDTCRELARYSIITSLPKAREDQVASQIPASIADRAAIVAALQVLCALPECARGALNAAGSNPGRKIGRAHV